MDNRKIRANEGSQACLDCRVQPKQDRVKIRVAITQGDTNGIGFELIFKTFSEPEMLELCTPIIYGSPKVASYHSKALDLHCQFSIINKAEDARDGRINLLACVGEDVKVEFGKRSEESAAAAVKALVSAVSDCRQADVDVVVVCPMETGKLYDGVSEYASVVDYLRHALACDRLPLAIFQNELMRMATVHDGGIKSLQDSLTEENIISKIRAMHDILRRDFLISGPRIALLALDSPDSNEENALLETIVRKVATDGIQAFGPYRSDSLFASHGYDTFDGLLAMYPEQGRLPMKLLSDEGNLLICGGLAGVCVIPDYDTSAQIAGQGIAKARANESNQACLDCRVQPSQDGVNESLLREAIFRGVDIFRARHDYEEAHANPLEKLYKERPDSGEKLRFSMPKAKE